MLRVDEVKNRLQLDRFIELPYRLYKNERNWIPPLSISQQALFDLENNPFWKTCDHAFFLAIQDEEIVGRIAVIIHHQYNKINSTTTGFFGFLEAIDEKSVFSHLFEKAERWLKERGCEKVTGPVNPSINYELGTLVSGFELPPYLMMTYNFEYYPRLIEKNGYTKEMDFFAYYTGKDAPTLFSGIDRVMNLTREKYQLTLRRINKKDFDNEISILHGIYNDAFSKHYGFVPMTLDEFRFMGKDLAKIVDEDYFLVAEYNKTPVGFILALPNYNEVFRHIRDGKLFPTGWLKFLYYRSKIRSIRILTIAIRQKYHHLGVGAYLYSEIIKKAAAKKTEHGEMSWVAENNVQMNKAALKMGAVLNKKYRLYSKNIS